ncbi:MAG: carboxypeptidase regulatory-like domain-containing protein [Terracidiphilus sp.]|jgi:hypothetical protein
MLVAVPVALHAQAYYGSIVGTVSDANGAAVPGAKITATANATDVKSSTTSSGLGAFSLAQLAVGTYTVRVTAPGFKESVTTGVEVHVSTNTGLNVALTLGAVSEKVTVQADEVQVETTSAAAGEVVTGAQLRELPLNSENFVSLTQLSPGVSAAANFDGVGKGLEGGVNFSVNGNPYTNNLFLVDGVNNNDVGSNRTILVYPAVDTIAEFKMIRNSFGAEYGQASGAVISVTTKSGQNQFHGGFFYSGRNDALDANDWVSNNNKTGKSKLRKNDYGYNVSGPIKKDRLWVWWNQEWDKDIDGSSFAVCVPTAAEQKGDFSAYGANGLSNGSTVGGLDQCGASVPGTTSVTTNSGVSSTQVNPAFPAYESTNAGQTLSSYDVPGNQIAQFFPTPTSQNITSVGANNWASPINNPLNWSEWNVRPDFDINKSNRATFRWTQDSWTNPFPNNGSSFWGDSEFPTVGSNWSQPSKSVMAKVSSTINNSLVNDIEFGYGHNAIITTLAGNDSQIVNALHTTYPPVFPTSLKQPDEFFGQWGGLSPYGSYQGEASFWNIAPYKNHEDLYTIQDNLSKVKGNHLLKVGAFFSNNIKVEDGGNGADRPSVPSTVYCNQTAGPNPTNIIGTVGSGNAACANTNNPLANLLVPGNNSQADPATALPNQVWKNISEGSTDVTAQVKWHDFEWYLTDSWKISRNLSVDLGFRWSIYFEPYSADNQWANWSLADWSATEAASNPGDSCNGLIVAKGTTPCQKASAFLSGIGFPITLSNGTQGSNSALVSNNYHDIAPRVGVSWDIFGNGKTALRLGGGQFYQRELVGIDEGMEKGTPFSLSLQENRTIDSNASVGGSGAPSLSPNYAKGTRPVTPNSWQWNITVEQELAKNTTLEVGYVGNTGIHLTSMYNFNQIPQSEWLASAVDGGGTGNTGCGAADARPACNFGAIEGFQRFGHATYHSLQTLFKSQVGASTFQASYTWSHSIGDVEMDNSSGTANQEANTVDGMSALDKGNTNINRPNIFVANEVYYLPKLANKAAIIRESVGGWQLNSIFTASHGSSLTVFTNAGLANTVVTGECLPGATCPNGSVNGTSAALPVTTTNTVSNLIGTGYVGNNRPLTTGVGCNSGEKSNQILNSGAFTLVGYKLGTIMPNMERRGYCYGAPTTDWDAQIAKNWEIKEKYRIKFSMDFFDLLNHPNFDTAGLEGTAWNPSNVQCGDPTTVDGFATTNPCSTTNSTITSAPGPSIGSVQALQSGKGFREVQYGLKFSF